MPLSRADLPAVADAIRILYRVVESPEASTSWAPAALAEIGFSPDDPARHVREKLSALRQSAEIGFPPDDLAPQPVRSHYIWLAGQLVLHRLLPSGAHFQDCADITESLLDLRQKTALLELVQELRHPFFGEHLASDRALALRFLAQSDDVLDSIGGTAARPTGPAEGEPGSSVIIRAGDGAPAKMMRAVRREDLLRRKGAGYRPTTEISRIVCDLNNPSPASLTYEAKELRAVPSPTDVARQQWLPILKAIIANIPELAERLTEENLRQWLWRTHKVRPDQDLGIDELVSLMERSRTEAGTTKPAALPEVAKSFIKRAETYFRWAKLETIYGAQNPATCSDTEGHGVEAFGRRAVELQRKMFDLADDLERAGYDLAAAMERQSEDSTAVFAFTDAAKRVSAAKALSMWPPLRARLERIAVRATVLPTTTAEPPQRGTSNDDPDTGLGQGEGGGPTAPRKQPSDDAMAVYRLWCQRGGTQEELARLYTREKRPVTQGTVSRWIADVKAWLEAGNVLPDLIPASDETPMTMDPERIDLGANREHRAEGQKKRRTSDPDG